MAKKAYKPRDMYFPKYWTDSSLKLKRKEAIRKIESGEIEDDEEIEELKKTIKKVESDLRKRRKYRKSRPYTRHVEYRKRNSEYKDPGKISNPECISSDERALELINEALEHLGEAYDLLEIDYNEDDPVLETLAVSMENADIARSYLEE